MYSKGLVPDEYYVIFTEAKLDHWIFKLLHKDYGHVYAVKELNDYQWLLIQPRANIVETRILLKAHYPHIRLISGPSAKVIQVQVNQDLSTRGGLNWYNCVEQVKALIGVKSFLTFTPKQLHDRLMGI